MAKRKYYAIGFEWRNVKTAQSDLNGKKQTMQSDLNGETESLRIKRIGHAKVESKRNKKRCTTVPISNAGFGV